MSILPPQETTRAKVARKMTSAGRNEMYRVLPMLVIVIVVLVPSNSGYVVLYDVCGVLVATALGSHILRRLAFPYLNLESYARRALDSPIAAALVFLAVTILTATFVIAGIMLMK